MTGVDIAIFTKNVGDGGKLYSTNCIDTCCLGRGLRVKAANKLIEIAQAVTGKHHEDGYSPHEIKLILRFLEKLKK